MDSIKLSIPLPDNSTAKGVLGVIAFEPATDQWGFAISGYRNDGKRIDIRHVSFQRQITIEAAITACREHWQAVCEARHEWISAKCPEDSEVIATQHLADFGDYRQVLGIFTRAGRFYHYCISGYNAEAGDKFILKRNVYGNPNGYRTMDAALFDCLKAWNIHCID